MTDNSDKAGWIALLDCKEIDTADKDTLCTRGATRRWYIVEQVRPCRYKGFVSHHRSSDVTG